jgi:malonyl-CoA O-methyltransferase
MNVLSHTEAYRRWAPTYSPETAISQIEDEVVKGLTPALEGCRLLDAGCGTGRRLIGTRAQQAVGVDASEEMIEAHDRQAIDVSRVRFVVGDFRSLPVEPHSFDVAWCRLAVGHVRELGAVYAELARAVRIGGVIIVTDFHPAAAEAGHRRTFRVGDEVCEVEHYVHHQKDHLALAALAGLHLQAIQEGRIGPAEKHLYAGRERDALYAEHVGLPVVLALSFERVR